MLPGVQMVNRKMNAPWVCKSQGHSEAAVTYKWLHVTNILNFDLNQRINVCMS